jgi:predicted TIM-barrel fold metal-dependent hydrolase
MKKTMDELILVSLDDHLIEPPDMYDQHLTAAQKAFKPTFHTDNNGRDYWLFDGKRIGNLGLNAVVGRPKSEFGVEPLSLSQMRKGCYDLDARVADMNVNGILSSLSYPTIVSFDGSVFHGYKDKSQALTLLKAYNDWHIDEVAGDHPGRFIPNALLPFWDMQEVVKEIERVAKKGVHSVNMMDNPANRGFPSIHNEYWDPMWKACADHDIVISMHHGTGNAAQHPSMESPVDAWISCMSMSINLALADYLHLDALNKYRNLKFALIESGIGWIPYLLARADFILKQHSAWTHSTFAGNRTASQVFQEQFLCTFVHDDGGFELIDQLGANTVCYEADYPHSDTQWPRGPEALMTYLPKLNDQQIDMVTHENALKAYKFDAFGAMGGKQNCTVGALRALAKDVDTREVSMPAHHPAEGSDRRGRVTSGDVARLFAEHRGDKDSHHSKVLNKEAEAAH